MGTQGWIGPAYARFSQHTRSRLKLKTRENGPTDLVRCTKYQKYSVNEVHLQQKHLKQLSLLNCLHWTNYSALLYNASSIIHWIIWISLCRVNLLYFQYMRLQVGMNSTDLTSVAEFEKFIASNEFRVIGMLSLANK